MCVRGTVQRKTKCSCRWPKRPGQKPLLYPGSLEGAGQGGRVGMFSHWADNWSGQVSRAFGDIPFKKYGVLCLPELMKFKVKSASWMQIAYFSFNRLTHHEKLLVNALVN